METNVVDFRKMMHEWGRMLAGEIPYDEDYLKELIEGDDSGDIEFSLALACDDCGGPVMMVKCPECQLAANPDCGLCDGAGQFLDCSKCDDEDIE